MRESRGGRKMAASTCSVVSRPAPIPPGRLLIILPYPNINNHRMFSACWSRCEKIFGGGGGGSGRNRTHDLLITRQASYHCRSPRLPDGCGWFDSHNSRRYCVDLSINDLFKIITSTKLFNIIKSTQPK